MLICDMHCDSLLTVSGSRGLVSEYNFSKGPHLQFVAEFCPNEGVAPELRRRKLISSLNTYLYECDRLGLTRIGSGRDVFRAEEGDCRSTILTLEGGGGLFADSEELLTLKNAGLSVLGMAWDKNELSSSAFDDIDEGLTHEGERLVDRCAELGIILDVSHLSDRAFYETLEISSLPVLATHSNFRDVCRHPRNLTRDMAEKIAARGGVIGINLCPAFLNDSSDASADDILRHVDYALSVLGEDSLGFGFDIDGIRTYPQGISLESSIHEQVVDLLLSHYSSATVEKIAGANVMNFLKENLI